MTRERQSFSPFNPTEHESAAIWNNPDTLARIEEARYPTQRALGKIVSDVFRQYVHQGSSVFEVGAGLGFMKDLVPLEYHQSYISSDYNINNLRVGKKRRKLTIQQAAASNLPLANDSTNCIVNMDAYDTLPNLQEAMNEAQRVLTPSGMFIHFQVNYPSDDTVWVDHPDLIFFPARYDELQRRSSMVGVNKEDFERGLGHLGKAPEPFRKIMEDFSQDPSGAYVRAESYPNPQVIVDLVHDLLDAMPIDKYYIPSLNDYFKNKLGEKAIRAGLTIAESQFRGTSLRLPRSSSQLRHPQYNEFAIENGSSRIYTNRILELSGSNDVIEKATMLVFVSKKI